MAGPTTRLGNARLDALTELPLLASVWRRRTHRVSRGSSIGAGSMSWTSSELRTPLTELEEAVLISLTGCTGLTIPERPFADPRDHKPIMAKPNLNMVGRAAGSPGNAQGTWFFMINDTGTYFRRSSLRAHLPRRVRRPVPAPGQQLLRGRDRLRPGHLHLHLRDPRAFPAHCDTIHVPGVWLQAHHVEQGYYEKFFRNGLTEQHLLHDPKDGTLHRSDVPGEIFIRRRGVK